MKNDGAIFMKIAGGTKMTTCLAGVRLSKGLLNRRNWIILIFIVNVFMTTGCGGVANSTRSQILDGREYSYEIPKSVAKQDLFKGLYFPNTEVPVPNRFGHNFVTGAKMQIDYVTKKAIASVYNGEYYQSGTFYASIIRYYADISISEKDDWFIVTLAPTEREVIESKEIGGKVIKLPDEAELIHFLSSPKFADYSFQVEKDSPYGTESVYATFKRTLKETPLMTPYKDPMTGKIYKSAFLLNNADNTIRLYVDVFPYRNGCKAVVNVVLPVHIKDNKVEDISAVVEAIKKEMERIIQE